MGVPSSCRFALCFVLLLGLVVACSPRRILEPVKDESDFQAVRKIAEKGDATAQFQLGSLLAQGKGVTKDDVEAAMWIGKAADQGLPVAEFWKGMLLHRGQGVPKDESEAVKWYRKSADQGFADAQCVLGFAYSHTFGEGQSVPKDDGEAVKWFRKAAEQNYESAQQTLGMMYSQGLGVAKDDIQAYMWLDLSGGLTGSQECKILAARMTPEQLAEAQRLSREWKAKNGRTTTTENDSVENPA